MQMKKVLSLLQLLVGFLATTGLFAAANSDDTETTSIQSNIFIDAGDIAETTSTINGLQPDNILNIFKESKTTRANQNCENYVHIYDDCKDWNDNNNIYFQTRKCWRNSRRDWVGLYKDKGSDEVGQNKGYRYWQDAKDWFYICGHGRCYNSPGSRYDLKFSGWWGKISDEDEGTYRIYFFKRGYYVAAASEPFEIRKTDYCEPQPTQSPTHQATHRPTRRCRDRSKHFWVLHRGKKWRRSCKWAKYRNKHKCKLRVKYPRGKKVRDLCPRACKWCSNLNPPTTSPTSEPTRSPTHNPTESPSESPTGSPSQDPSFQPSASKYPSESPSEDVRRALQVENHIKQSPKKDAEPEKLTLFE